MTERKTILGFSCGVAAGALWGFALLAPALIRPFTPLQLACARFTFYGLLAALLILPHWKKTFSHIGRQEWLGLLALSLLGNIVYYVLFGMGVQMAGSAMPTLIVGFLPVTVTIIGSLEHGAVPLRKLIPSILLSVGGMGCIAYHAYTLAQNAPHHSDALRLATGLLCAIGALLSWSAYAIKNARWLNHLTHTSEHEWNLLTGLVTGILALCLIPVGFLWNGPLPQEGWSWFLTVSLSAALLASIIGNAFWNKMSRLLPLTMVGQMILFETLFALIYAFIHEHRLPAFSEILAILLVGSSVITCMHAHRKPVESVAEGHG
ncbi:DMT family transporter [Acetobacteraceae bacterium ESL0709]|nr:DMT family transporter [Acetobacteraceae bacterium ESL0697]MDF7678611.1 DMT family transporter [Acetobacteraceae bacterium ESL0709]